MNDLKDQPEGASNYAANQGEWNDLATIKKTAERAVAVGIPISEKCLRRWIAEGRLPFVPAGRKQLIYWPRLMEIIETGERADPTPPPRYGPGSRKKGPRR